MTHRHTPSHFRPVPAVPIVVVSTTEGDCRVLVCGGVLIGPTLCAALDAACRVAAAAPQWRS